VEFFGGTVTIIRPLIYVEERRLADFGRAARHPQVPACPKSETSQRAHVKRILREFGPQQRMLRANLWRAARREMGF
jgi:tRNA 2-thiocytidine biosynthesis protein TtcA